MREKGTTAILRQRDFIITRGGAKERQQNNQVALLLAQGKRQVDTKFRISRRQKRAEAKIKATNNNSGHSFARAGLGGDAR